MINIKGLTKTYSNVTAVREVNLEIPPTQRLVVLGPSGCGKTTLLRLIAGLEKPDAGEIVINGKPMSTPKSIVSPHKRGMSMVFQDLALWPHMNIMQNVGFGLENIYPDRLQRIGEIHNILRFVQLEDKLRALPSQLSGGERQRVALARALIRKPGILLMDEPFASLDHELKESLIDLILDLLERYEITLIYVTHDKTIAMELATHIGMMKKGSVLDIRKRDENIKV